jgi:elongator complex protein 1
MYAKYQQTLRQLFWW